MHRAETPHVRAQTPHVRVETPQVRAVIEYIGYSRTFTRNHTQYSHNTHTKLSYSFPISLFVLERVWQAHLADRQTLNPESCTLNPHTFHEEDIQKETEMETETEMDTKHTQTNTRSPVCSHTHRSAVPYWWDIPACFHSHGHTIKTHTHTHACIAYVYQSILE